MENPLSFIYVPKEIMTDEYHNYSIETKLLFAMILSNAETASSISNVARLIDEIGIRKISSFQKELKKTIDESEGA